MSQLNQLKWSLSSDLLENSPREKLRCFPMLYRGVSFQGSKRQQKEGCEAGREGGRESVRGCVAEQTTALFTADFSANWGISSQKPYEEVSQNCPPPNPHTLGCVTGHSGKWLGSQGLCGSSQPVHRFLLVICGMVSCCCGDGNSTNSRCSYYGDILSYCKCFHA